MKHQLDFEKPIAELQSKLEELKKHRETHSIGVNFEEEIANIERKIAETRKQIFSNLTAWQRVQLARHPRRPFSLDYLQTAFTDFSELHGDRLFAEDRAVVGGFARLDDRKVMGVGTQKGRETKENIRRNFGSAHPEGYRKALRLMRMADKFNIPIAATLLSKSAAGMCALAAADIAASMRAFGVSCALSAAGAIAAAAIIEKRNFAFIKLSSV